MTSPSPDAAELARLRARCAELEGELAEARSAKVWPIFGGIPVRLSRHIPKGYILSHPDTLKVQTSEELEAMLAPLRAALAGRPTTDPAA